MIDRMISVIPVNEHEAVTAMRVSDLLDVAIPARSFLNHAKLGPLEKRIVGRLRDVHDLIQRDFTGEKKRNAQGSLADYIQHEWLPQKNGNPPAGFMPSFILFLPDKLDVADGKANIGSKGLYLDGESRGEGLLVNVERMTDEEVDRLLNKVVAVHVVHGIGDVKVVAKYFADTNGKGVGVNPNLMVMRDYTDPFAEITKRVFADLGLELETEKRQVPASSDAVMTGLQARQMVAAIAKGVGVVQYGAKPIPDDDIDFGRLESVAKDWLGRIFGAFPPKRFRDKDYVLRAVPVAASLAALGKAFNSGTSAEQKDALEVLGDKKIDWKAGAHWTGLAGKLNPQTKKFAVGGGKEYAYATWRALTERGSDGWKQIRHATASGSAAAAS